MYRLMACKSRFILSLKKYETHFLIKAFEEKSFRHSIVFDAVERLNFFSFQKTHHQTLLHHFFDSK